MKKYIYEERVNYTRLIPAYRQMWHTASMFPAKLHKIFDKGECKALPEGEWHCYRCPQYGHCGYDHASDEPILNSSMELIWLKRKQLELMERMVFRFRQMSPEEYKVKVKEKLKGYERRVDEAVSAGDTGD